jgi:hypothetical protein
MPWLVVILVVLLSPSVPDPVRIVEVLSDVAGPEGDGAGEWVELLNAGSRAVELTGWSLGDRTDPDDRLLAWTGEGPLRLEPGGRALVLDPDSDPAGIPVPTGTLLLRPEDSSIGNGLRAAGDRLVLTDRAGAVVDTVAWSTGAGEGISWERIGSPSPAAGNWRPSRAPAGSTPGEVNSWTPQPGDRTVRLQVQAEPTAGTTVGLSALVREEGGQAQSDLKAHLRGERPGGGEVLLFPEPVPMLGPFDSVRVVWSWCPDQGGVWWWEVTLEAPPGGRGWWDRDTLTVEVRAAPRERFFSEAMPEPLPTQGEWLELSAGSGPAGSGSPPEVSWAGWTVGVGGVSGGSLRRLGLPAVTAPGLLLHAATEPVASDEVPFALLLWPGLRLSDAGSRLLLFDPCGAVVDSAVLRPVSGLPRGHARVRWYPDLPGWLPIAWGVALRPEDATPGRLTAPPTGAATGFQVRVEHPGAGTVVVSWEIPAVRARLRLRLFDLDGRPAATLLPESLVPGRDRFLWQPGQQHPRLEPGLYVLVVEAEDADGAGHWRAKLPLGVRP